MIKENTAPVRNAIVFVNLHKKNSGFLRNEIQGVLEDRRIRVTSFCFEGRPGAPPQGNWDIAFSLGGDGTVLYTARIASPLGIPVFPVNLGTLGFISGVPKETWLNVFDNWLSGSANVSRRCMLEISVHRRGELAAQFCCLNDAVVCASGIAKLIRLELKSQLDGGKYIELGPYRCDGLIIATPTGSTAYSMAAGGPIVDPEMEAMILNPICPLSLSSRPLVLPARQTLEIAVAQQQRSGVLLTIDGQDTFTLESDDRIIISQAPFYAVLISSGRETYYRALRTKLNWAEINTGDSNA